ncbi:MAG: pyridoxamine 5'-phosphate oxidase family protein [Ignavibacteriae bacterium]|nr:pyridoxamine 5'-phosphate oxidase family protein [Ignavibacteriota bacterium]
MKSEDNQKVPVRRKNREITDEQWIKAMLHQSPYGAFALANNGLPYLNVNLFVYNEKKNLIYFHTAGYGRTRDTILQNPNVCFSVFEMGRLIPAPKAVDFSTEYKSVTVFGTATVVNDLTESTEALKMYFLKYGPQYQLGVNVSGFDEEDVRRTSVFRLAIEHWTGKQNKKPEDYEGAYHYIPKQL